MSDVLKLPNSGSLSVVSSGNNWYQILVPCLWWA